MVGVAVGGRRLPAEDDSGARGREAVPVVHGLVGAGVGVVPGVPAVADGVGREGLLGGLAEVQGAQALLLETFLAFLETCKM